VAFLPTTKWAATNQLSAIQTYTLNTVAVGTCNQTQKRLFLITHIANIFKKTTEINASRPRSRPKPQNFGLETKTWSQRLKE